MTKNEIKQALIRTLEQMPNFFSSMEFCDAARTNGITDYHIKSQVTNKFLKKHCVNDLIKKRSWYKQSMPRAEKQYNVESFDDNALDKAIALVKSYGFTVCKKEYTLTEI